MAGTIDFEFFYDCSSPWTYFAFTRILPLMAELGLPIRWRPIVVGGVFNAVNREVYALREALFTRPESARKRDYYFKDLQDWAALCGVTIALPANHPISSVKAMRGAIHADDQGLLVPYSRAVFEAYWGGIDPDIASDAVLAQVCNRVGLDPQAFFAAIADPACKARLRDNPEALIERGGFGSPTLFINGTDMYFGNDRLPLVEHRLRQLLAA